MEKLSIRQVEIIRDVFRHEMRTAAIWNDSTKEEMADVCSTMDNILNCAEDNNWNAVFLIPSTGHHGDMDNAKKDITTK